MTVIEAFLNMVFHKIANNVILWCIGLPVAVLFAAYLIGIAVMCTRELWSSRRKPRSR